MTRYKLLIICFLLFINAMLYSNVSIKSYVDKRSIFYFQDIIYTIEFCGEYQTFSFDGINEKDINDFDVIDKNVESTIIHSSEYKTLVLNKKIIYRLKPITKGTVNIPSINIKYFTVSDDNVLTENSYKLDSILIRIYGNTFLIFSIVSSILVMIVFVVLILILIKKYINKV